ncbi:MAG TPA: choice-of-anchor D domain-containing protein, partial [Gemmatimonadales bacterium]|nr:choice-of-anchor D domain-containing protein [Gemmatimonadales bacterium]
MWTTKLCLAAALTALSVAGCTKKNPHKCNTEEPCTLVDAPYCDITGQFGGTPYRCIPDPGVDKLRVDPSSKDFGSVALGQSSSATTFTITNTGTAPTGSLAVSMGGANLSSFAIGANTCAGQTLAANATCTVAVTFQPTAAGAAAGELSVTGTPGGTARAALAGNGLASGALAIAPATQDFGSVVAGQNSATTTFTITNPGAAATGALTVALSGGDSSQFALTSDGCSTQTLSAGGSCNVVVRFNPTTAGTKSSSIMVTASPGGSTSAVLMGTGLMAGALTISPTSRDYGPVPQGGMSAPFAFTVTNTGGATTGSLSSALTGTGSDQFSITTNGCAGMTLASQATCMIAVRFDPTSAGSKNASLTVSGNPGGNAATALTGMGLSPATLSVMPAAQNYGDVAVGNNSTATITVSNSGGVASGTPSVAITGADMALFTIASNTCVGALPPAGSCTASVRFAPTSAGNKAAMLTASATPGGMAVASLNGNGLAPGNLAIAPTARDFGSVLQGQMSSALSFTVSNSGQTATSSLSVGLTGSGAAQFSVMTDTCSGQTLAPSASCM